MPALRRSKLCIAFAATLAVLIAAQAIGQQTPALEKGFSPEKLYQFGDIDSINTFNGNLTARIPLGPSYPINGGMSYQLGLTYNSKIWDYEEVPACTLCPPPSGGSTAIMTIPSRRSNAGLGWLLSFGRIITFANSTNTGLFDVYESPDGADHVNQGVSQDGTYIRRTNNGNGTTVLEFADGTMKTFDSASGDFLSARDRFGNGFDVATLTSPTGTPCLSIDFAQAWKITDTSGARTNYVCFTNRYSYPQNISSGMVERVVLVAPPDERGTAQQAIYQFSYSDTPKVCRGFGNTFLSASADVQVPLLTTITQPDSTRYDLGYSQPYTFPPMCRDGELGSIGLPTGATITYGYGGSSIPVDKCNSSPAWNSWVIGVAARTISGPKIPPNTTWHYTSSLSTTAAQISCENNQGIPVFRRAPAEQMIVTVTDPLGNVNENYYSVWPVLDIERIFDMSGQIIKDANGNNIVGSPNGFRRVEYGFPTTHLANSDGRPLSQRVYSAAGYAASSRTPLRSFYRTYEHDAVDCSDDQTPQQVANCANSNARVRQDRTVYEDDNGKIADVDSSDFDGLGHYRTVTLGGNFTQGNATIITAYNKHDPDVNPSTGINSGTYPGSFTPPAATDPWLIGMPWSITRTEGGGISKEEMCFSPLTGFLRARRIRTTTTARSSSDLLTLYEHDAFGNVTSESSFGGDIKNNAPDDNLCAIADASPTDFEYKMSHTYTNGVRATSQYSGVSFLSLARSIDPATGLVLTSSDTAGQPTDYKYDAAFRLTSVAPTGRALTSYHYSPASGSGSSFSPARVEVSSVSSSSNTTSGAVTSGTVERHYLYDSLGRLWREKIRLPNAEWSVRDILYNSMGWKDRVSEQEKLVVSSGGSELDFVPSHVTAYSNYDPFGRPGSVTLPDTHVTSFGYLGARSMIRTSKIATSAGSESDASVTETYDRQGRLYQLTENSAPDGSAVVTTYGHHVTGGLSSVSMNSNGTLQNRTFAYDGRGLLLHEEHPEKGGQVIYGASVAEPSYDSRGHATRLIDGPIDLTYAYDAAERLLSVSEIDPTSQTTPPARRILKSFTYGQSNDFQKGRLLTATRMNHLTDGRAVTATETYTYNSSGAISKRDTAVAIDGTPFQTFSEPFAYDDLGELASLTYPTCLTACGAATGAVGVSERHYTNGALTSINGYATIGYNANATVGSVAHSNGVSDTIAPDDSAMARPKSIAYSGFIACPVPSLPVVTPAPTSLCTGQSGGASVQGQQGATFTWTIEGGNITSNTGLSITYTATSTTSVLLHVRASNSCGSSAVATAFVSVTVGTAIQQQPQNATFASGSTAALHVTATGTALTYQWYRGFTPDQSNPVAGATAADFTTPPLTATTTYWVKVTGQCGTSNSASATITINLPAPTGLRATTQQATPQGGSNTVVTIRWNSVPGASAYLVEWSASVNGSFAPINPSNPTTAQLTATHVVTATTLPAAYVYHVRSVDSGGTASTNASNLDYAVAGARLFANVNAQDEPLRKGLSPVRAMDIVELRRCIDALRGAAGLSHVWDGASAPSGFITADDFLSLQSPLNLALQAFGYGPFAYSGVAPPARCITSPCVPILSEHVQQLRDTLRNALR